MIRHGSGNNAVSAINSVRILDQLSTGKVEARSALGEAGLGMHRNAVNTDEPGLHHKM